MSPSISPRSSLRRVPASPTEAIPPESATSNLFGDVVDTGILCRPTESTRIEVGLRPPCFVSGPFLGPGLLEEQVTSTAERLWDVVEPYVAAEGIELDDIEVVGNTGGRIVRITVDDQRPVAVGRLAELSRGISRLLDEEDPIAGSYTMEVSSPGLERKLRRPRHYEKAVGTTVKVKTHSEIDGEKHHSGVLVAANGDGFVVDADRGERRIPYRDVASARTVFVWEKQSRRQRR